MLIDATNASPVLWLVGVLPIVVLVTLVLRSRLSTGANGVITTALALVLGWAVFGADLAVTGVAVGKGVWTGLWILYVIWTALLLYHIASVAGLDRMGSVFSSILPRNVENVLIVAWIFPSFIQGVAGFGTPIAVAAPLLVAMGYGPVRAVALPLVGYHWSVTFGSMGSSFYMGALTAGLVGDELAAYARDAGIILAVNMLLAGGLVCFMHGGLHSLRRGARMLLTVGSAMAITLLAAVHVEPAIGSLAAGSVGFLGIVLLRTATRGQAPEPEVRAARDAAREHSQRVRIPDATNPVEADADRVDPPADDLEGEPLPDTPDPPDTAHDGAAGRPQDRRTRPVVVLLPYAYLLVIVLAAFLPEASRDFVRSNLLIGPSFPATATAGGMVNPAVDHYTPIALLGHPGSYILLAATLGLVTYRLVGAWPARQLGPVLRRWAIQARRSTLSVVALTTLATVMVDTGMVRVIATGAAELTGSLFPAVSPIIGALGSFTTGSTTTSNALFSALQRDVALLIDVNPSELLAAQTAGGNVGNALAPVVILIGATAIDARERIGDIFRAVLAPAALLAAAVITLTFVLIAIA